MPEGNVGDEPKKKRGRPKGTMSKPKAETQTIETPKEKSKAAASESVLTAAEVAVIAESQAKAAATQVVVTDPGNSFTHNRGAEQIFRREMGEPEFWLDKLGRAPKRTILSQDEEQEISRLVEIPTDQIPSYKPEHILSPEYGGTSNYEIGIKTQKEETQQRLVRLRSDPNASAQEINRAEEDLKTLDYLYENYNIGMNVFRTAKGGRAKLRE
jgi:colicin import membrane protein